jgi:hypothetical protein
LSITPASCPSIIDPHTREIRPVELFMAVLGASNYTYAEATLTQRLPDWIASHTRAFAFFGGAAGAVVCDQLKSGVALPCRYEPGLQRTYEEFLQHYGVGLPARPHRPRDKAKAEVGVQMMQNNAVSTRPGGVTGRGFMPGQSGGKPLFDNNIRLRDLYPLCRRLGLSWRRARHGFRHAQRILFDPARRVVESGAGAPWARNSSVCSFSLKD